MAKLKRKAASGAVKMGQTSSQMAEATSNTDKSPSSPSQLTEMQDKRPLRNKRHSTEYEREVPSQIFEEDELQATKQEMSRRKQKRKSVDLGNTQREEPVNRASPDLSMGKPVRHKRRKGPEFVEQGDEEAESALTLMKLRNNGIRDDVQTVDEDDLAASAQLVAESSPVRVSRNGHLLQSRGSSIGKLDYSSKRGRCSSHETPPSTGHLHTQPSDELDLTPQQHHRLSPSPQQNGYTSGLLKSTLSLDDIDSDDEGIANYLQDYQYGLNDGEIPREDTTSETQDIHQQLANEATVNDSAGKFGNHFQHITSLPPSHSRNAKKPKRTRKKSDTRGVPEWNNNGAVVDSMPIDPKLSNQAFSVQRLLNYNHENSHDLDSEAQVQAKPGRLRRVASRSLVKPRLDKPGKGFIYHTPEEKVLEVEQEASQDQILPGIEDLQRQASQGVDGSSPTTGRKKRRMPTVSSQSSSQRRRNPPSNYDPPLTQLANNGGMFTSSERDTLFRFRDSYCAENEMTEQQFADRIHASARNIPILNKFWTEICDEIPYRSRQSIQKFCRRQFHNFAKRGSWTKEEDAMLEQAVAVKGKSWKAVGEMCERMAEDCRDRYRNYIYNSSTRNKEEWTDSETKALCRAVAECMWLMSEERRAREEEYGRRATAEGEAGNDLEADEMKLINWQIVSDKMGGKRSRLQCSYKWRRLQVNVRERYVRQIREARRDMLALERGELRDANRPWRLKRAEKKVANMKAGDKYDLLQALSNCGTSEEENIPWKSLGADEPFRRIWSTVDCKAAWAMMKDEVPGSDQIGYLDIVNRLLTRMLAENVEELEERWRPEDGYLQTRAQNVKKKKIKQVQKLKPRRSFLSEELVPRSSGSDEADNPQAQKSMLNAESVIEESKANGGDTGGDIGEERAGLQSALDEDGDSSTNDGSAIYSWRAKDQLDGAVNEDDDVDARLIGQLQLLRDA